MMKKDQKKSTRHIYIYERNNPPTQQRFVVRRQVEWYVQ